MSGKAGIQVKVSQQEKNNELVCWLQLFITNSLSVK